MGTDLAVALEWFQENLIKIEEPSPLSVTFNNKGEVLLMVLENRHGENMGIVMLWTDFNGNDGYSRIPNIQR